MPRVCLEYTRCMKVPEADSVIKSTGQDKFAVRREANMRSSGNEGSDTCRVNRRNWRTRKDSLRQLASSDILQSWYSTIV